MAEAAWRDSKPGWSLNAPAATPARSSAAKCGGGPRLALPGARAAREAEHRRRPGSARRSRFRKQELDKWAQCAGRGVKRNKEA